MSDLAGFLLARLAEDEAVARAADTRRRWWVDGPAEVSGKFWVYDTHARFAKPIAEHVARYDPKRVLADVAAKRAIVELWRSMTDDWNANTNLDPDDNDAEYLSGASNALYTALKLLALPYAEHADYDEGWRP